MCRPEMSAFPFFLPSRRPFLLNVYSIQVKLNQKYLLHDAIVDYNNFS